MTTQKNKPAVPPRPTSKPSFLGVAAVPTTAPAENMSATKTADMTFKMPPAWHMRFKATAAMNGLSMKELLVESFEAWEREKQAK